MDKSRPESYDPLVRLSELFPGHYLSDPNLTGLTFDSSRVLPGNLYFAVPGTRVDGHAFAAEAVSRGAVALVVERTLPGLTVLQVKVPSSRRALAHAASRWYGEPSRSFSLVGITGTNGKSTSVYLLRQWGEALGLTTGLVGTVENFIGPRREPSTHTTPDPLSLQKLFAEMRSAKVELAAMEVTSIALDQYRVDGSAFQVAAFTNLTQDHLDYHPDMESYFRAKQRFFQELGAPATVINIGDTYGRRLVQEGIPGKILTFSLDPGADFFPLQAIYEKDRTTARVHTPRGELVLHTLMIGRHNLANCLTALAIAEALDKPLDQVARALASAKGAPGRLERVELLPEHPKVFVDYAHTPDALHNVLSALNGLRANRKGKLVTVFGCGGDRDKSKRPLMGKIVSRASDITIATSDNPRTENPDIILDDIEAGIERQGTTYHRDADRRKAIRLALELSGPEDLVLIAGKGHEAYQILGDQKLPFDDREVVREYYGRSCTPGSD